MPIMDALRRLRHLRTHPPAEPTTSFSDKTVIVTGANSGVGLEAVRKYVNLGAARVILTSRSLEKGQAAKTSLQNEGAKKGVIEVWQLDMLSYDSIKAFARRVEADIPVLDIVLLNAGLAGNDFRKMNYGWDETLQVNLFSTTLLAILLLPKLRLSAKIAPDKPVLEFTSSGNYTRHNPKEEQLQADKLIAAYNDPQMYKGMGAPMLRYSASKFFLMYSFLSLVALVTPTSSPNSEPEIHVQSVCPGPTYTGISRNAPFFVKPILWIVFTLFFRSANQGANTLVTGTALGQKGHGKFWQHDEVKEHPELFQGQKGEEMRKRVWNEIIDDLRRENPEILDIVGKV